MPTMFRKRKDANEETMAMGRVVGVRNASPAHRVAALVIEHPNGDIGVALLPAALQAALQDIQWFAAGGHKNVHLWIPA